MAVNKIKKAKADTIAGSIELFQAAELGHETDWPSVVTLPEDPVMREKALQIYNEGIETREREGFSNFEKTQLAIYSCTSAMAILEFALLEKEGAMIPNPTNNKYFVRNNRLDAYQTLNQTRTTLAKALKLYSSEDNRALTSRRRAFDSASGAVNRSRLLAGGSDSLLAGYNDNYSDLLG